MPDIQHDEVPAGRGAISAQISTGAVQLLTQYTGRGPTKAHTIINRDSVTVILRDLLTKGERNLVAAGRTDEVLRSRHVYQEVMEGDLTGLVEDALGRKVVAFLSANHIDPDIAVEFFLLESDDGQQGDAPAGATSPNSSVV